jgi:DNA invertase Pin-like site-specific DNA recombinase
MTAAVIYTRVSTTEQVDNLSLVTQERECRAYCDRVGFTVDRVFREEGESAKTANRTELQELLAYCAAEGKRRDIGVVVVYRVDRLARAVVDHTVIRTGLLSQGITVRAVAESFDDTPSGKFIENVMAATAQFDNDLRSARTTEGMKEALRRGRWTWQAPLGYLRPARGVSASMILDPDTAPLVKHGFEAIASRRVNKVEALDELTDLGLKTRRGRRLTKQSFGNMLRNPLYMGRVVMPTWDIDVQGDFEPIVDASLFQAVQDVLHGRSPAKSSHVRDHPDFPLRRVVRCGRCSSPLTGSWSTGRSRRYAYYRCPMKGCGRSSRGSNVRKEDLEELLGRAPSRGVTPRARERLRAGSRGC